MPCSFESHPVEMFSFSYHSRLKAILFHTDSCSTCIICGPKLIYKLDLLMPCSSKSHPAEMFSFSYPSRLKAILFHTDSCLTCIICGSKLIYKLDFLMPCSSKAIVFHDPVEMFSFLYPSRLKTILSHTDSCSTCIICGPKLIYKLDFLMPCSSESYSLS